MNIHTQNSVANFLLSLPNLKAWHRAASLALSVGNPLAIWKDASGNGADVAQIDLSQQPKFALIGGKPAVLFDGSNDWLSGPLSLPQPCTLYAVINSAGNVGGRILDGLPGGPNLDMQPTGQGYTLWAGSLLYRHAPAQVGSHVVAVSFDAGEVACLIDGVFTTAGGGTFAGTNGFNGLALGGAGNNSYFNGSIFETMVFAGAHSPADMSIVSKFLAVANGA